MNKRLMVFSLFFCAATLASAAEIYKWKDAQGHVHYGAEPAAGAEKVEVNVPASQIQLQKDREKVLSADEKQARRMEECKRGKEQLLTYQNASSVIQKDSLGGEKELNTSERAKLIQITQQKIKEACEEPPPS